LIRGQARPEPPKVSLALSNHHKLPRLLQLDMLPGQSINFIAVKKGDRLLFASISSPRVIGDHFSIDQMINKTGLPDARDSRHEQVLLQHWT